MSRLPVIVGIGGVNPAGRVSFHHAFRRIVIDAISAADADDTYASLAALMRLNDDPTDPSTRQYIRDNTLIRRISLLRSDRRRPTPAGDGQLGTDKAGRQVRRREEEPPGQRIPSELVRLEAARQQARRHAWAGEEALRCSFPSTPRRASRPPARSQPDSSPAGYTRRVATRGVLELAVFGASDAVHSLGLDWSELRARVRPDAFAVYAGSAMGQLDANSNAGLMQAPPERQARDLEAGRTSACRRWRRTSSARTPSATSARSGAS